MLKFSFLIARQQIDEHFFDTPYYVAPNEPVAQDAFAVIREAMRHKTMVALGRLVLSKRERVIALGRGAGAVFWCGVVEQWPPCP